MAVVFDRLQQSGWCHIFTEIVMRIGGQPVVAVYQRHEGQSLGKGGELQLLLKCFFFHQSAHT